MLSTLHGPPNYADFYEKMGKQLDGVCRRRKNIMKVSDMNALSIWGHSEVTNANDTVDNVLRKFGLVNATNQSNRAFENSNQSLYREQQKRDRKSRNFRHWYSRPQINLHTIKAVKNKNPLSRLLEKLSIGKTFIRMLLKSR